MQQIWRSQAQVLHLLGWKNGTHPFHRHAEEFMHWQTSSPASFWKMQGRAARQIGNMSFKKSCKGRPNICVILRWFLQSLDNEKRCGWPGGQRLVADHQWMNSFLWKLGVSFCQVSSFVQPSMGCLASLGLCFSEYFDLFLPSVSFKKWTGLLQVGGLWLCSRCESVFSSHLSP